MAKPKQIFHFKVDSALLGELGEKLVSTVHVALAELVKNAYDADATHVHLRILPAERGRAPTVVIEDNGVGMTIDQVTKFWMKIGTPNKVLAPVSEEFGRLKTGSKGVGRFAARRLGKKLSLETIAKNPEKSLKAKSHQRTAVEFNWDSFVPGTDVDEIPCSGETETLSAQKSGTRLEISGKEHDEWQVRGYNYLTRQLALLTSNRGITRKGFSPDPGFNVTLEAPNFNEEIIDLRESVVDASWGTVTAHIADDGRAHCELKAKGLPGTRRYSSKNAFVRIVGASLRIGILPASKEEARNPNLLADYVLQTFINEWGGYPSVFQCISGQSIRRARR